MIFTPRIEIHNIQSIINFRIKLEGQCVQIQKERAYLEAKFAEMGRHWTDNQKRSVERDFENTIQMLNTHLKNLNNFIDYLKRVETAARQYLDH